jgi:4-amino-4-deoxy-L-arabinose transferase-like glycosyltransferase
LLIYVLIRRKGGLLFRARAFYFSLLGFLLIVGGYYAVRETQQPGFMQAVYANELGGRYNGLVPGTDGSNVWTYYYELVYTAFAPWALLIVPAICAGLLTRRRSWQQVAVMCSLVTITVLAILSGATTRLWWYMMPVYPMLALLCGMFMAQVCSVLNRRNKIWRLSCLLPVILLAMLLPGPYQNVLDRTIGDKEEKLSAGVHDAGVYLQEVVAYKRPLGGTVLCGVDTLPLRWYQEVLRGRGLRLDVKGWDSLARGDKVLSWDEPTKEHIWQQYDHKEIESFRSVTVYSIESKR